jgi:hypothetical protein
VVAAYPGRGLAAAKLVLDRVMPAPRTRPVEIDLPAIGRYGAADALLACYGTITAALAAGEIAPSEAAEIIAALDAHNTAITDLRRDGLERLGQHLEREGIRRFPISCSTGSRACCACASVSFAASAMIEVCAPGRSTGAVF